jgi:CzcA family heavy metal efflux pump
MGWETPPGLKLFSHNRIMNRFFHSNRNPVAVLLALVILGGLFVYSRMQTTLFPEISFPKIKIIAEAGLQPVNKMMIQVTKPLENAIKQVPNLQTIRSTTSRGSCEISAFMDWSADVDISQQRIESKIAQIRNNLPPETSITVEKMNPSILPVIGYTLESSQKSPIELKQLANYTIKPFLSQVPGVSEVRVIGGKMKEYWLQLDARKMSALMITPDTISAALAQTNFIRSNGYMADFRFLYLTITDATVHSSDDILHIVIRNDGKRIIHISDVATVDIKEATEYTRINANGREGILIAIIKQPNANLIDISDRMQDKLVELRKVLHGEATIEPYYIQADFVKTSIKSVSDSLLIGLGLAIIVAVLFLRSLKASTTILVTIPVTICLTLIVLYVAGFTFNIMTLGAIAAAIGLVIDDAIVVVEQIHRTHEEFPDEQTTALVHKAVKYLLPAMIGSSLSTIVIFIPFEFMSGVAGAYFRVLTNTMIITLVCSFFVSWIGLPVIYLLLSKKSGPHHAKTVAVKKRRWVSFFVFKPWISFVIILFLMACIYYIPSRLETGFLPEMNEGSIVLDYASPPGTSLEETDRMLREVEKIIVATPEVAAYSRRTGTQMGFFITEPNTGDYLIELKPGADKTTDEVISLIRAKVEASQPALRIDFGQVITDMLGDLMSSVQPVEIKIFGDNPEQLHRLSNEVAGILSQIKGTADVFNGIVIAGPSITITPDYNKLAQFGLSPAELQYQVQTYLEGNKVGELLENEQMTPIRMLYPNSRKSNVADIQNWQIFLPGGKLNPITSLAKVTINPGDAEIQRQDLQSMGVVTARLEDADLGSVMKNIQEAVNAKVHLPAGYHITYGGSYAEQQQSFQELLYILLAACLLVFCVILFLFQTFNLALLILGISILGISGSYLALFLTGTPLNVGSYTGLIMIVGIIAENAIFTILQFREARLTKETDESVIYAISTRLRPKLMTALGAIIALLPLALGIGAGAQLHQPLAIAVIGGFVVAIPLLLIVFPSMLRLIYRRR